MTAFQITVICFGIVTVALGTLEVAARRRESWPNLGDVFTVLASGTKGRFLVMLGWWWLGWHFFVR